MSRIPGLTTAAALAAAAGCAPPVGSSAPPDGATAPIMAGLRWTTAVSGAGAGLTLSEADGTTLLRLACVRGPATMTVSAPRLRAIGGDERLTLGLGDQAHVFVAAATADARAGVEAAAPIRTELLDALSSANDVSVVYGAQRIGPHIPPDPDSARTFAAACRQVSAS